MRTFVCLLLATLPMLQAGAQKSVPRHSTTQAALERAIISHWIGFLEYRDYSEPATSTKRVRLPTWLNIRSQPEGLRFEYIYDDGPDKVVASQNTVVIDAGARTYKVIKTDYVAESYTITGLEQLNEGRGTLILTGSGKDSDKPAEIRTTWTIGRNALSWLEEVRPAGSAQGFVFRHHYTLVRAEPPPVAPAKR